MFRRFVCLLALSGLTGVDSAALSLDLEVVPDIILAGTSAGFVLHISNDS